MSTSSLPIPPRFLFDFTFPLRYCERRPAMDGSLKGWSNRERLPELFRVDDKMRFAEVWAAWNEEGLFVAMRIAQKGRPPMGDPATYWESDVLRLCLNLRYAPDVRRATRFCQQFFFMPVAGKGAKAGPAAGAAPFRRAQEESPPVDNAKLHVAAIVRKDGYQLEGFIPADLLSGFRPEDYPRIGFYYIVEDRELGKQYLTVGDELQWYADPSTWAVAVLEGPRA